uniref:Uncharacterized protein n=1 Tax=Meloidogyne enterolobii TaxID=390850 RepID=A0A6V7XFY4_MELEN|nr:unnamed protein product [Meloidogyne enterolobii]
MSSSSGFELELDHIRNNLNNILFSLDIWRIQYIKIPVLLNRQAILNYCGVQYKANL